MGVAVKGCTTDILGRKKEEYSMGKMRRKSNYVREITPRNKKKREEALKGGTGKKGERKGSNQGLKGGGGKVAQYNTISPL